MNWKLTPLILLSILSITGCSYIVPQFPKDYPLIPDTVNFDSNTKHQAFTFAVTAERRFVIFTPDKDTGGVRVCAEPSPDVAQATSSLEQLGVGAQLGAIQGAENAAAAINNLSYYATAQLLLTQRSQGLQFYRDGMYYYCQMYSQGDIKWSEYQAKEKELREIAAHLIEQQLQHLPDLKSLASPSTITPQAPTGAPPAAPLPEKKPDAAKPAPG